MMSGWLLTINTGSSSLKAAVWDGDREQPAVARFLVERISADGARWRIVDASGVTLLDEPLPGADQATAIAAVISWLRSNGYAEIAGVGHRVVHGGDHYTQPVIISPDVVRTLGGLVSIDPDHMPGALSAIEVIHAAWPSIKQVACFDTAFHAVMPRIARLYALPRRLFEAGVRRYGFHGLSYEYVTRELRRMDPAAGGHVIIAHLGSGASMAAIRNGVSIDTTMGFSPSGGLVMSTRTGDLDPGVLLYLLDREGGSASEISDLINHEAGLLGLSGSSADMRELLARESHDNDAADAIEVFCYQARKHLGSLAAVLGGIDTLVFTGGIGEHSAAIRARICTGLQHLGVEIDPDRNQSSAAVVSARGAGVTVRVIATDEDVIIAAHTRHLLLQQEGMSLGHVYI